MKAFFLMIAITMAGAYIYPSWHERTHSVCGALEKRAGEIANAQMQGPGAYAGHQVALGGLMRDSSGGIATAAIGTTLPGVPPALACTIGYWRLVLSPNINQVLASSH